VIIQFGTVKFVEFGLRWAENLGGRRKFCFLLIFLF